MTNRIEWFATGPRHHTGDEDEYLLFGYVLHVGMDLWDRPRRLVDLLGILADVIDYDITLNELLK